MPIGPDMILILRNWRWILGAMTLAAAFGGGYRLALYQWRVADLRAEVARQAETIAAADQTAAVLRAHYARQAQQITDLDAQAREFQSMGGRDAPLSDHLGAVAGRLWP